MFSRFTHVVSCISIPYLKLNNIPLYGCSTLCLSIHWVMDTGYFHFGLLLNNVAMNIVYKFLCEPMFPVLLDICLGRELLAHDSSMFNFLKNHHLILFLAASPGTEDL